jgi:2-dehydro-3-deoxygluconokinase
MLVSVGEGLIELTLGARREEVRLGFGGDAANVCVMAARVGVPARLIGRVGDEAFGDRLLAFWAERGVDVRGVRRDGAAATGLYLNEALPGGDHRFTYWRRGSAGSRLAQEDFGSGLFDGIRILVVTGVTLAVSRSSAGAAKRAIVEARSRGARVACVLNHRPALEGDIGELISVARASNAVIASREDAGAVFGVADLEGLADVLQPGVDELVLTDGARPASVAWPEGRFRQAAPPVAVRNAAGAGDALAGAYLAARMQGHPPPRSLRWGVAAATLSVQRDGCASSYPTAVETSELVRGLGDAQPAVA